MLSWRTTLHLYKTCTTKKRNIAKSKTRSSLSKFILSWTTSVTQRKNLHVWKEMFKLEGSSRLSCFLRVIIFRYWSTLITQRQNSKRTFVKKETLQISTAEIFFLRSRSIFVTLTPEFTDWTFKLIWKKNWKSHKNYQHKPSVQMNTLRNTKIALNF